MATLNGKENFKEMLRLRRVYDTPDGREELERILTECAFFSSIDPDDPDFMRLVLLRNYAVDLMYHLGILVDNNIPAIVNALCDIKYLPDRA